MPDASDSSKSEHPFNKSYERYRQRFSGDNPNYEAIDYLLDLGLSWRMLKGKKILDIGAGDAEFGRAAEKRGITVVSLDPVNQASEAPSFVIGSANQLPYSDGSFDIVVARASMGPEIFEKKNQLIHTLGEVKRVLRPGGEFRFGPGDVEVHELTRAEEEKHLDLLQQKYSHGLTPQEEETFKSTEPQFDIDSQNEEARFRLSQISHKKQGSIVRKQSLSLLQSIDPNISIRSGARWRGPEYNFYFVMKKPM